MTSVTHSIVVRGTTIVTLRFLRGVQHVPLVVLEDNANLIDARMPALNGSSTVSVLSHLEVDSIVLLLLSIAY